MSAINNGIVATGADDETVKTWNVQKGTCTKTLTGHSGVSIIIYIVCVLLCWFDLHLGLAHIYRNINDKLSCDDSTYTSHLIKIR